MSGGRLILTGGILLIIGWSLVFLTILHILPPGFILGFLSYTLIIIGSFIGLYGAFLTYKSNRD